MLVTKIRIDGQIFFLDPGQDVDALKAAIQDAARTAPTFVEFDTVGHGLVSVLVTPTAPARFETVNRSDDEYESMVEHPEPVDIELLALDTYMDPHIPESRPGRPNAQD
ncbi:hypothetical protein BJK06_11055 [Curtobacterium sp. BH-2-1-1]|uniref:hypothetical protein n=1 Tax=Curtobacterium sp. BH-2-1-1 TaxID=1905847 RepID=UPI00089DFF6B|nr:hypothetical protein [Curtobacterium sp. BH-2-1-1]AOX66223.1 hypothetical protein BJK06_11055 [Curtobacterium sp. BH-2-1-1]